MAIEVVGPPADLYERTLRPFGIECSLSCGGCCHDGAVIERLCRSLEHEWVKRGTYAGLEDARPGVF